MVSISDDEVEAAWRVLKDAYFPGARNNSKNMAPVRAALSAAAKVRAIREGDGEVVAWRGDIEVAGEHTRKFTALKRVSEIWAAEGITVTPLYARPQGIGGTDEMVVHALRGLVLLKDLFDVSDGNPVDAYHILAKQDGAWGNARSALSALTGKE